MAIEIIDRRNRREFKDETDFLAPAVKTIPRPGVIYFLGGCDTGKTTLVKQLSGLLGHEFSCGYLDADPGQSELGPPSTIGLTGIEILSGEPSSSPPFLRFIGTTSPSYNTGPALDSLTLLSNLGAEMFDYLFIDSPGYISGDEGAEFQLSSIQAAGTGLVVTIEKENELEPILGRLSAKADHEGGWPPGRDAARKVIRISSAGGVRTKTQAERRKNRVLKFRSYFASAVIQKVSLPGRRTLGRIPDLSSPDDYRNLLCAVCREKLLVLSLALIKGYDPNRECLILSAPRFSAENAETIIFGRLYIDGRTGEELGKR